MEVDLEGPLGAVDVGAHRRHRVGRSRRSRDRRVAARAPCSALWGKCPAKKISSVKPLQLSLKNRYQFCRVVCSDYRYLMSLFSKGLCSSEESMDLVVGSSSSSSFPPSSPSSLGKRVFSSGRGNREEKTLSLAIAIIN